jgi:hypothetical protein
MAGLEDEDEILDYRVRFASFERGLECFDLSMLAR